MATHPKRESIRAAQDLYHEGKLPLADELREIAQYDPDKHRPNEELIRAKPERFAILAHFIKLVGEEVVEGEGAQARLKPDSFELDRRDHGMDSYIERLDRLERLNNLLLDMKFPVAEEIVNDPANARVVDRYEEIFKVVTEHEDSLPKDVQFRPSDGRTGREDLVRRTESVSDLITFIPNYLQILDYFFLTFPELKDISKEEKRKIAHDNIHVITNVAALNVTHATRVEHANYFGGLKTINPPLSGFSMQLDEDGNWKLSMAKKANKPTQNLMGATLGCPANYQITEGETALENYTHAVINLAFDRDLY